LECVFFFPPIAKLQVERLETMGVGGGLGGLKVKPEAPDHSDIIKSRENSSREDEGEKAETSRTDKPPIRGLVR
jgi:hypothetical protein